MSSASMPVAVITGASRGVGLAIAQRMAAMGYRLALCARSLPQMQQVAKSLALPPEHLLCLACDVADSDSVQKFTAEVMNRFGCCDVLVNNAGLSQQHGAVQTVSLKDWDAILNTNLRGPFLMLQAFAPSMIANRRGDVINVVSLAGKNPLPGGAVYGASKWGLSGLMQSAAEELREHGVRVANIFPGSIATDFGGKKLGQDDGWKLSPDDIAHAVEALLRQSDRSFISEVHLRPRHKAKA